MSLASDERPALSEQKKEEDEEKHSSDRFPDIKIKLLIEFEGRKKFIVSATKGDALSLGMNVVTVLKKIYKEEGREKDITDLRHMGFTWFNYL